MNDQKLRELLEQAHRADAPPPPFARLLGRKPRRSRARLALAVGLLATAAGILVALRLRPPPAPPQVVELHVVRAPLDFLLDMPAADLLRETPRFERRMGGRFPGPLDSLASDTKGLWP